MIVVEGWKFIVFLWRLFFSCDLDLFGGLFLELEFGYWLGC